MYIVQVISGHTGWVRSVAVEPANKWFATGSADRTIKVIFLIASCLSKLNSLKQMSRLNLV